jgi:hypothetical protein
MRSKREVLGEGESYTLRKTVPRPWYPLQKANTHMLHGQESLDKIEIAVAAVYRFQHPADWNWSHVRGFFLKSVSYVFK